MERKTVARIRKGISAYALKGAAAVLALAAPLTAASLSYTGNFTEDDNQATFSFSVPSQEIVTMRTWSYGGGTNNAGVSIAAGGFDPVLTLFDNSGNWQGANNDGTGLVEADPVTGNAFDSLLSVNVAAGLYELVLTESDNTAIDEFISDGFTQDGQGNFTCPEFLSMDGAFCDATPAFRDGQYAVDISYADSASETPEPGTGLLALFAAGGAVIVSGRRRRGNGEANTK